MAFTLETGDVVSGANAYIDVAFFREYHADRGVDLSSADDATIQTWIILATSYLDRRWSDRLKGVPLGELAFPRGWALYRNGLKIEGVPQKVKQATAEYALRAKDGKLNADPEPSETGHPVLSRTVKVGPVTQSIGYGQTSGGGAWPSFPSADSLMGDFTKQTNRVLKG